MLDRTWPSRIPSPLPDFNCVLSGSASCEREDGSKAGHRPAGRQFAKGSASDRLSFLVTFLKDTQSTPPSSVPLLPSVFLCTFALGSSCSCLLRPAPPPTTTPNSHFFQPPPPTARFYFFMLSIAHLPRSCSPKHLHFKETTEHRQRNESLMVKRYDSVTFGVGRRAFAIIPMLFRGVRPILPPREASPPP